MARVEALSSERWLLCFLRWILTALTTLRIWLRKKIDITLRVDNIRWGEKKLLKKSNASVRAIFCSGGVDWVTWYPGPKPSMSLQTSPNFSSVLSLEDLFEQMDILVKLNFIENFSTTGDHSVRFSPSLLSYFFASDVLYYPLGSVCTKFICLFICQAFFNYFVCLFVFYNSNWLYCSIYFPLVMETQNLW